MMPLDWKAVEIAFVEWAALQLPELDAEQQIRWTNANLPVPMYPFLTMKKDSIVTIGNDESRETTDTSQPLGEEVAVETVGTREFTLMIQASVDEANGSNDPGRDAIAMLSALNGSLAKEPTTDHFNLAGIVIIEGLPIQDLSQDINGETISRAAMDVRIRATFSSVDRTGYIDSVEMSSQSSTPSAPGEIEGFVLVVPTS